MDDDKKKSYLFSRDYSIDPRNRPLPTARANLATVFDDEETTAGSIESFASNKEDSASVFLRVRPTNNQQYFGIENNVFSILNVNQSKENQYSFSHIFDHKVMQREVYSNSVENAVDNDENLTLLMYGTSGSGKTYTLIGDADQPGIIPRAIEHIYSRHGGSISEIPKFKPSGGDYMILLDDDIDKELEKRKTYFYPSNGSMFSGDKEKIQSEHNFIKLQPSNTSIYIWISFFEIYNEIIHDLLEVPSSASKKRNCLKMMGNSGKTFVKDLTSVFTKNSDEANQLLTMGLNNRLNAATNINDSSSRSHCLFMIDVIKHEKANGIFQNSYRFCDLAGSERVKKSATTGSRLKEAQNINTSLLVLGRCLDTTFNNQGKKKQEIVPFRESKLTLFLQSSLAGKEKLTMIVNIWPITEFYDENLHVLNYASMAHKIVYKKPALAPRLSASRRYSFFFGSKPNVNEGDGSNVSLILDENFRLKNQNEGYIDTIEQLQDENDELFDENEQLKEKVELLSKINTTLEKEVRREMVEEMKVALQRKEKAVEERMQIRIDYLMKKHAEEVEELKAKIKRRDDELDDLYEENDRLRGDQDGDGEEVREDKVNQNGHPDATNDVTIVID